VSRRAGAGVTAALILSATVLGGCATRARVAGGGGSDAPGAGTAGPVFAEAAVAGAGAPDAEDPDTGPGMLASVVRLVEDVHGDVSDRFGAFMYGLDDFFAGSHESDEPNTSFVRVRMDARKSPLDDVELDPSVKLRVVLPRSEQRLRLLLSTEDDDEIIDGVSEGTTLAGDEQSLSLALRFVRRARDSSSLDFDLGTRQREGRLQLFGRANAEYREPLGERTRLRMRNRYLYYSASGFENRLNLDITHALDAHGSRVLRASSSAEWRNGRKGAILGQVLGAYADLDARSAIALEVRASYHTSLAGEVRDRYRGHELRVRYRRNVWRPWLFYEFWPSITWPAELGYRRTWNGLLRLEIIIGADAVTAEPAAAPGTASAQ